MGVLETERLTLHFGGITALEDVSLSVDEGELHAIIGPNGAGKTSLFNCISGLYRPTSGDVRFEGRSIRALKPNRRAELGIARTFQNIELFANMTVLDNLLLARHVHMRTGPLSGALYIGRARREETAHRSEVEKIIEFLEIEKVRKNPVGSLPYGIQKKVELGRALATNPKLLLLDEPVAGMNVEETEDIARFVLDIREEMGITIIMVEHDMDVVMDLADRITVLDFGSRIAAGSAEDVRSDPAVIKAYLGQDV